MAVKTGFEIPLECVRWNVLVRQNAIPTGSIPRTSFVRISVENFFFGGSEVSASPFQAFRWWDWGGRFFLWYHFQL